LLSQIGVPFQVLAVEVDESIGAGESPAAYVSRLAVAKARVGFAACEARGTPQRPTLAADTAVIIDGEILGKPKDAEDCVRMLARLSGRSHQVLTAAALVSESGTSSCLSRSHVRFREITEAEALDYWNTGEPADKAGSYAIQGRGAVFVADLHGSYSGVMGLPLFETAELLRSAAVPRWLPTAASGAAQ
jgi:septum formation protein